MITIATFTNAAEAHRTQALLENNGIHCKLHHDLLSETETFGKIELKIDAKDVDRARDVLANAVNDTHDD